MSLDATSPTVMAARGVLDRAETLTAAIEELVAAAPDRNVLTFLDRRANERLVSLGSLWRRAKEIQAELMAKGLGSGDCVVIALSTGAELVAAYLGTMAAGGIPALAATPFNRVADPHIYTQMLANILRNASARILYCEDDVVQMFQGAAKERLGDTQLLRPDAVGPIDRVPDSVRVAGRDIATIQYSSGTTGPQKGVQLSHEAMLRYTKSLRDGLELGPEDVHVNWAPLYHDMGLLGAFLLPLLCGCRSVLIPTADFLREPVLWLRAIQRYRGTLSWAPNFAYALCTKRIADSELSGLDLSSWRVALNASEPVLPETVAAFAKRFGPYGYSPSAMSSAWGLAEVVMVSNLHPPAEEPLLDTIDRKILAREGRAEPTTAEGLTLVATGRCLPGFEMQIRDETQQRLGDRLLGSIWLRSDTLFAGYRGDPDLTASIVSDGWIDSGDCGYTVEGNLFFVSRNKDLIILGGENYAPHDIEEAINRVPGVRTGCAVAFGVTNYERGTEDLVAVVETREEDPEALVALQRAIRNEVMRSVGLGIRALKLVPPGGIVKTTSGKLARRATQMRYLGDLD